MSVSVSAVGIGALFVGVGIGFMLGARQARNDARAVAPKPAPTADNSSDAEVAVSASEPRLNPREELKMTFVCLSSHPNTCCFSFLSRDNNDCTRTGCAAGPAHGQGQDGGAVLPRVPRRLQARAEDASGARAGVEPPGPGQGRSPRRNRRRAVCRFLFPLSFPLLRFSR